MEQTNTTADKDQDVQNQDTQSQPVNDAEVFAAVQSTVKDNVQNRIKNKIGFFNIATLIFVLMIIVSWYIPLPAECGARSSASYCETMLPFLLQGPIVIMSVIVGVSFIGKMLSFSNGKSKAAHVYNTIVGVCGAFCIFIFGVIAGIGGAIRTTGSV
jgi:hypothetical protein